VFVKCFKKLIFSTQARQGGVKYKHQLQGIVVREGHVQRKVFEFQGIGKFVFVFLGPFSSGFFIIFFYDM